MQGTTSALVDFHRSLIYCAVKDVERLYLIAEHKGDRALQADLNSVSSALQSATNSYQVDLALLHLRNVRLKYKAWELIHEYRSQILPTEPETASTST